MLAFIRTFVAVILALMAFVLVPTLLLLIVAFFSDTGPQDDSWLTVRLSGSLLEHHGPTTAKTMLQTPPPSLTEITENLEKAAVDDRIEGVLFRLEGMRAGLGKLDEIRAGIRRVRDAGKPVFAYASFMQEGELYLASECDSLFLFPRGDALLTGRGVTIEHLKGSLDLLDVEPSLHRIEKYKSAAELFTAEHASDETRENIDWLIRDIAGAADSVLCHNLDLAPADLQRLRERALFSAEEAVAEGLADGLLWWDELEDRLAGHHDEWRHVSSGDYAEVERKSLKLSGKTKVAVIHAQGFVGMDGDDRWDPAMGLTMGVDRIVENLQDVSEDDNVKAIVLRWDTGGGATVGGEKIARAMRLARDEKPLIVSIADVAASAGYTMSYPANVIVCPANGITGSIGSITGKFNMRGLWEKLGVSFDDIPYAPHPFLYSSVHGFTEAEWERIAENHWDTYRQWVAEIAEARGVEPEAIDAVGRGRVWSGRQGLERSLVDRLGGFEEALAAVRELCDLDPDAKLEFLHYPQRKSPLDILLEGQLGTAVAGDVVRAGHALLTASKTENPAAVWAFEPLRVH